MILTMTNNIKMMIEVNLMMTNMIKMTSTMKIMTMKDFNDPKDNLKTVHQGWAANYHL